VAEATARDDLQAQVLAHLPIGVWVGRAPSGELVYANATFREIVGMAAVEGVGIADSPATYPVFDQAGNLFPTDELPFCRVLASGQSVMVDNLVVHRADGRKIHVRAFGRPLRDGAGIIRLVVVGFVDITGEVNAIAEARTAHQRMIFAVEHAPVLVYAIDRNGIITLSEGSALAGLGFRPGELVGRPVSEVYGNRYAADDLRRAYAGEVVSFTVDIEGFILDSWLTPVRDERGEVDGVIGVCTDVTDQRRLQTQIIQNDRLAAMGTLAASVAHEINNPLTYILGNLDHLDPELRSLDDAAAALLADPVQTRLAALHEVLGRTRRMLAQVRQGADRIRQVARDLRSFVRPDETVTPVELGAVVNAVLALVRKEIETRAQLVLDLQSTPPIMANQARLVQVVLNLLINAWQALPPDQDPRRQRVELRTSAEAGWVMIEVGDTGPGVPPENVARIFEPFFTTKEVGVGTGLGLFVCRNIVSAFGGEVSVHDRPGGGALFRVRLPGAQLRASSEAQGREPSAPASSSVSLHPRAHRPRVLLIDDDEGVALTLAQALRDDFEVQTEHDARRALDLLLTGPRFDLVYCDLMMRGLTGMDIHERLREGAPELLHKLVFMTGGAFTPRAACFVERDPRVVVYKPFDILGETRRRLGLAAPSV
jgi:PAS domain S-box-containing protein